MKAASLLTGLTPDTLRAWERRYGAVTPSRSGTRRRMYDELELERLRLLKRAGDLGHPIRVLAPLSDSDLRELIERGRTATDPVEEAEAESERRTAGASPPEGPLPGILAALEARDLARYDEGLRRAAAVLPPAELVERLLSPLLFEVGRRWEEGRMTVAEEHFVSATVRDLVGGILRTLPRKEGRPVVFGTPEGERHEFGILMTCLVAAGEGTDCHYLGPDAPSEEIAGAARAIGAPVVALGLAHVPDPARVLRSLRSLSEQLDEDREIWVGGRPARLLEGALLAIPKVRVGGLSDFLDRLRALREERA